MLPARTMETCDEVEINNLSLPFWKFYIPSQTTMSLVFKFLLLTIQEHDNKPKNVLLYTFPPIYFSQVAVFLCGTRLDGISRVMSLLNYPPWSPSILGTHNLP